MKTEQKLFDILKQIDACHTVALETKFFDIIENEVNLYCPEDIEQFIDGYSDKFHNIFRKVGSRLGWSFNF